jgi:glycosyltransferase involved in cell wall biosynthesis
LLKVSPQKISVVYEGYQHMIDIPPDFSILNRLNQNIPYILAVSSLNTNKNFKLIINCIEAVCDLGLQIVIVGGSNPTVFKGKNKLSGKKNFVWLGRVSDNELKALYTNAFCFVYPSFFEGFGLPPLEAQACGSFCIISSTSCLPEIYSDSVLYCDPHEKETLIEAITLLKDDESKRNLLKDKMEENLTKYSWKESAVKIHYLLNFKQ